MSELCVCVFSLIKAWCEKKKLCYSGVVSTCYTHQLTRVKTCEIGSVNQVLVSLINI